MLLAIAAKRIDSKLAADFGIGVGDTTGTGVGNKTGAGVGVAEGVGLAATFTPLLQTNLLPDLTQVYFKPLTVEVVFNLGQASPALTAAFAKFKLIGKSKVAEQRTASKDFPLLIAR